MTAKEHRDVVARLTQAEIDLLYEEFRVQFGESERDAAVRDTNHLVEVNSK